MVEIKFNLNGKQISLKTDPLKRLIDVLREDFGLNGTKEGCGEGECGACSILLDGVPVTSCTLNAIHANGKSVKTVESVVEEPLGKIIMDAFYQSNAVQCGFCFPGFMITTYHYIKTNGKKDEQEIKRAISGNICRCTGYKKVVESIMDACDKAIV
mmetsp:Transcript_24025/g.11546  ORF Transcript_24025/g.11546 Transcript_24025/m.11546 type:complete len:156 (+) Transcript_24025:62-529(+)